MLCLLFKQCSSVFGNPSNRSTFQYMYILRYTDGHRQGEVEFGWHTSKNIYRANQLSTGTPIFKTGAARRDKSAAEPKESPCHEHLQLYLPPIPKINSSKMHNIVIYEHIYSHQASQKLYITVSMSCMPAKCN